LATPVVNIWFFRAIPSKIGTLLGISVSRLERVVYYADYIVTGVNEANRKQALNLIKEEYKILKSKEENKEKLEESKNRNESILKNLHKGMIISEDEYLFFARRFGDVFEAGRGGEAILEY